MGENINLGKLFFSFKILRINCDFNKKDKAERLVLVTHDHLACTSVLLMLLTVLLMIQNFYVTLFYVKTDIYRMS